MRRSRRLAVGAIGVMLVVGSAASALAANSLRQHPGATSPESGDRTSAPATVLPPHQLETSTIVQSDTDVVVPPGRQAIGATTTVTCPGSTTCTFEADQYVQLTGSTDDNKWAVCTHVDGQVMAEPLCPYLGLVPNGFYGSGSFVQTKTGLTPGDHQIKTTVYAKKGATVTTYAIIYRMYTP